MEFDFSTPIIIIGGGAAGMVAALTARDAGASPLIIERDRVPSGSTGLSSGMVPACGTRLQAENSVEDSVEILAADIAAKAKGSVLIIVCVVLEQFALPGQRNIREVILFPQLRTRGQPDAAGSG